MAILVYGPMGVSLDGFTEDENGDFGWSEPSEDLHRFANSLVRDASALLFGRRMFEAMEPYWPELATREDAGEIELDFARAYVDTPRYVFSDSLETAPEGVRLVRRADARAEVERLKAELDGYMEIAGPALASSMTDLVDEFRVWVNPVLVGRGKPYLADLAEQIQLRLVESHTFDGGALYLRYERADSAAG